jgi:hypothetical protein
MDAFYRLNYCDEWIVAFTGTSHTSYGRSGDPTGLESRVPASIRALQGTTLICFRIHQRGSVLILSILVL